MDGTHQLVGEGRAAPLPTSCPFWFSKWAAQGSGLKQAACLLVCLPLAGQVGGQAALALVRPKRGRRRGWRLVPEGKGNEDRLPALPPWPSSSSLASRRLDILLSCPLSLPPSTICSDRRPWLSFQTGLLSCASMRLPLKTVWKASTGTKCRNEAVGWHLVEETYCICVETSTLANQFASVHNSKPGYCHGI